MSLSDLVLRKLETLPTQPGVYVFYGQKRVVLYVGKARSLRSRVRSYFQPGTSDGRAFIARLHDELIDLETFVTGTEKEAALLENQLIKAHQPRYNVKLKDDKEFLSLRINPSAPWPRIDVVRKPRKDGASYYGPYHSATAARQTLRLVNRHFQLRTCTDAELSRRVRPCLQYQIKRCPAPCVLDIPRESYLEQVRDVGLFLSGRHDELVKHLEQRMAESSRALDFEQAAVFRDQLRAVSRIQEEQRVASVSGADQDVVGLHRVADQAEVALLRIREGKLVNVRTFGLRDVGLPDDELVASFVSEFYAREGSEFPDELLLPNAVEAMDGLAELLSERRQARVKVLHPQRGPRVRLLQMARENAAHAFQEKQRADQDVEKRLLAVQDKLRLPTLPRRIECIDISHSGGQDTVAAVVSLLDGQPERARYRSFHLQTVTGGDDYGAIYEVLSRRFKRALTGDESWELPDLLVVDGGRGQLRMALEALRDLGMEGLPLVGLAKEKENVKGEKLVDRVYLPEQKNPIPVQSTPALQMLALARDEAHRSSNRIREQKGTQRRLKSELESIPGVGAGTRTKLLRALGSVDAVLRASDEELLAAGANRRQVAALRAHAATVARVVPRADGEDAGAAPPAVDVTARGAPSAAPPAVDVAARGAPSETPSASAGTADTSEP
ncbi:MAG: excinuclease ABC subunit UvrC [Polyangiales bacterium]